MTNEDELRKEISTLKQWVADLHSGMYVNCVYCGHRYGPRDKVPTSMANVLKEHIEECPKHPLSLLKTEVRSLQKMVKERRDWGEVEEKLARIVQRQGGESDENRGPSSRIE